MLEARGNVKYRLLIASKIYKMLTVKHTKKKKKLKNKKDFHFQLPVGIPLKFTNIDYNGQT